MPIQENIKELFKVKGCVYMATSPSGKKYIGMTTNFYNRYKAHKYQSENCDRVFCKAIRKYGIENLYWEILFTSEDKAMLMEMEMMFISQYDTKKRGYNMNTGGIGNGNMRRESVLKFIRSRNRKPIHVFELPELKFIKTYEIQTECAKELGIPRHAISECLSNQKGSHGKPRSKKAGNYYVTRNPIEYVIKNRNQILSYLNEKQFSDRSVFATRKNKSWTIEERDAISFGQTGRKYSIQYLFSDKIETHSNYMVIADIVGVSRGIIEWGLKKRNPFFIDDFKIVKI